MIKYYEEGRTILYGTLKECVDELWKTMDLAHFPKVNYAASVMEDEESVKHAYDYASGWFGFADLGSEFDSDTVVLLFGHWGGGGVEVMELAGDESEKEILMQRIGSSTDKCGYGVLEPNDMTVFEIMW